MKKLIVGFLAGLVAASATAAGAASHSGTASPVQLRPGQTAFYGNKLACVASRAGRPKAMTCLGNRRHYDVVYDLKHVTIFHNNHYVYRVP
jgi:hypothetical protein